jgi:hypothetical protein
VRPRSLVFAAGAAAVATVALAIACSSYGAATGGAGDAASGEAAADAADAAQGWCASQDAALFCSDFDESPNVAVGYSGGAQEVGDAGDEVTLDPEGGLSPPAAALSTAGPHAGDGGSSGARLMRVLWASVEAPDTLTCELSLRLRVLSATANYIMVASVLIHGAGSERIMLEFFADARQTLTLQASEVTQDGGHVDAPSLAVGALAPGSAWTHVTLALTGLRSGTPTAVASVDTGTGTATVMGQVPTGNTSGTLYVGVADYSPTALPDGWSAEYDNVLCR